jgi:nucleoside-diphosphate-sugar epimerase
MNETHALWALLLRALRHEDPYLIWGDGKQGRDWLYVSDAVGALIKIAQEEEDATSYNVVSSGTITIDDLVEKIFKEINWHPKKIIHDTTKPVGPYWRSISCRRLIENTGYWPRKDFDEGLKATITYAKENYATKF